MSRLFPTRSGRPRDAVAVGGAALLTLLILAGCSRRQEPLADLPTATVERRDIEITVEASGTVEPINLVEVKSKASGQIVQMPVEIGSVVQQGNLLVQIDTRDVQNSFDQAEAALAAAEAKAQVTGAQRKRAEELFAGRVITAEEHEAATFEDVNAQASLVRGRTDLDLARQRLEDATVTAPIVGTVLEKPVAVGQVISSATSSVSGGTTLLKMADLSRVRMRTLVTETDIGRIQENQEATVVVDAYPDRQLRGVVENIEPQAVVQQSVTMFPVLVSIANQEGLLMPGMNGEITVRVDARSGVLAVPVDAVRSSRELASMAEALGLDLDALRGNTGSRGQRGAAAAMGAPSDTSVRADSTASADRGTSGRPTGGRPEWGGGQKAANASESRPGGNDGGSEGGSIRGLASAEQSTSPDQRGGRGGAGSRAQFVIVQTKEGYAARPVRVGISNYDDAEILAGLEEGESVVLLSAVGLQQERSERMERFRSRVGSGIPGSQGSGRRTGR